MSNQVPNNAATTIVGVLANRPQVAPSGTFFFAVDTTTLYGSDGTNWQTVISGSGTMHVQRAGVAIPGNPFGTVDARQGALVNDEGAGLFGLTVARDFRVTAISAAFASERDFGLAVGATAGAVTMTMPAAPGAGEQHAVKVLDAASAGNGISVAGNGHNIEDPATPGTYAATVTLINLSGLAFTWQFVAGTPAGDVWSLVGTASTETAIETVYDDTAATPALGKTNVQGAIDFLKSRVRVNVTVTAVSLAITAGTHYQVVVAAAGAPVTVTLPAAPAAGDQYEIKVYDAASAAQGVTTDGNGHNVEDPATPGTYAATATTSTEGNNYVYRFLNGTWGLV